MLTLTRIDMYPCHAQRYHGTAALYVQGSSVRHVTQKENQSAGPVVDKVQRVLLLSPQGTESLPAANGTQEIPLHRLGNVPPDLCVAIPRIEFHLHGPFSRLVTVHCRAAGD